MNTARERMERETEDATDDVLRDPDTEGQEASRLKGIDFGDMAAHLADGQLVKGLISRNSLVGVIGQTGSGKTFFSGDLAVHIAPGRPWRGKKVNPGLVVYAALEGPVSAENRFVAARDHAEIPKDIPLRLTAGPINLRDPADAEALIQFIHTAEADHKQKCVAVFVDTLARAMHGGDENRSEDMGALIAGADAVRLATGAAVILVHHLGKDESRGARGHSSLKAALDTEIEVSAKDGVHVATVTKQRDLPSGAQYAFRLQIIELGRDEDGDPVTSCVVEYLDEAPSRTTNRRLSGVSKTAVKAVEAALEVHGQSAPGNLNLPLTVRVCRIDEWRDHFGRLYGTDEKSPDALRKAFQRGKDDLLARDLVVISNPWVWTP